MRLRGGGNRTLTTVIALAVLVAVVLAVYFLVIAR